MSHQIECPSCSKRYQVADSSVGKRVRCQQCGATFTVAVSSNEPLDPFAGNDFSQLGAAPGTGPRYGATNPPRSYTATASGNVGVSNPSGDPTDAKMRFGACGMLGFALVLVIGSLVMNAITGSVFMFVLGLVPLCLILGFTGLISPNVIRAMGEYGGHLPVHYKYIGWGLAGSSILLMFPIMIGLYVSGYRTDVPRPRPQVRHVRPAPSAAKPAPSPMVPTTTAEKKVAPTKAIGDQEAPNSMKRRKSYPVSINVPEHSMFVPPKAKLTPGTKLEACWSGKWNPITTLSENDDGSVNVRWDDFGEKFDCSMVRHELIIRKEVLDPTGQFVDNPPSASAPRPATTNESGGVDSTPKPLKSYPVTIAVPADSQFVPRDTKLQPATRLQACWAGKWNPITFLSENNDGTLTVRWDDFGAAFDCRMIRTELIIKNDGLR